MASDEESCAMCKSYQRQLIEKEIAIKLLTIRLEKIKKYVLNIDSDDQHDPRPNCINFNENGMSKESSSICCTNSSSLLHAPNILSSSQVQNTASFCSDNINEEDKTKATESKLSSDSDYVYDQNYRMYYNQSTGYYYDEKSGLMYDPKSCIYYKYSYNSKKYEEVSFAFFSNLQNASDAVVHQKSGLMYDPRTCIYYKYNYDTKAYEEVSYENSLNQKTASDGVNQVANAESSASTSDVTDRKSETVENSSEEFAASKDWLVGEGSNVTVADKVREVVIANCEDFIYDDSSKTYILPSTGQYFDTERNLLYDPSTAAYYSYNNEEGKYEYYCQANSDQAVMKESSQNENAPKLVRLKQRKQFWKRKWELSQQKAAGLSIEEQNIQATKVEESADDSFESSSEEASSDRETSEEEFSSPEDGEIFSSSDESDEQVSIESHVSIIKQPIRNPSSPPQQRSESDVLPAIRAIVVSSESMQIGSLILISADSDFIGRNQTNSVILTDTSVSKVHAEVKFDKKFWKYSIQDLGSQNGTFINGHRLSEPKEKSGFYWLNHENLLSLGSCKFLIHIHPELETCDSCEPGQVMSALTLLDDTLAEAKHVVLTKEDKEKQRREELRKIKKKYNLQGADFQRQLNSVPSKGYEDKALIRRRTVGSDNPYEKTEQASVDKHIPESNKGYQMLQKMGWKLGEKLGAKGDRPEKVPEGHS